MEPSPAFNLASLLARSARMWPRLPAVASGARVLHDYAALARRAARMALALREAGLAPGDRVLLVSQNAPAYVETLFACWWAGLVAVPVNSKLHPRELAFVQDDSDARWAFADTRWCEAIAGGGTGRRPERVIELGGAEHEALCARPRAADIVGVGAATAAWLFYTSGTTGRPKGVVISHGNLLAMAQAFLSDVEAVAPGDAILHPAPLSHGSGLYAVPHVARGAVSVVPESGGFDAGEIVALLDVWDRVLFFAAPTMVKRLVGAPAIGRARLDRLKCIVYGGGPMYVEDCKTACAALGPRLAQIYGQGETPMTITAMDRALLADAIARGDDVRLGSVGVAQLGVELRIADADDHPSGHGMVGEVQVRGPTVMQGYWRNPDATSAALAGGWLHTGDLGVLDADGFLTLKDRSKDLIISGGSNIYPREVEEALLAHPGVAEAAVVGRRHPEWGEEVVACIVARDARADVAMLERALDAHCLARIARFKRPKAYAFLDELPKNETGKVLKTALRTRVEKA
jgi:acyl-CoA synthetase (AMP-forming)/AMP-acid ligase II